MNKTLLLILLSFSISSHASDAYEDGSKSYKEKKYQKAFQLWSSCNTDVRCIHGLGILYTYGQGVEKDLSKALKLYKTAAKSNYGKSLTNIAGMYYQGLGVEKNMKQAAYWYEKAVEKNILIAANVLGVMYLNGQGVTQNPTRAAELFKVAANGGIKEGMYNLGILYAYGRGVTQDIKKADELFASAHKAGYFATSYPVTYSKHLTPSEYLIANRALKIFSKHCKPLMTKHTSDIELISISSGFIKDSKYGCMDYRCDDYDWEKEIKFSVKIKNNTTTFNNTMVRISGHTLHFWIGGPNNAGITTTKFPEMCGAVKLIDGSDTYISIPTMATLWEHAPEVTEKSSKKIKNHPISDSLYSELNSEVGCNSKYSDNKKEDIFNKNYKNHWMTWKGEIMQSESEKASLNIDGFGSQDLRVAFSNQKAGYDLNKNTVITVKFLMKRAGGCFLPFYGEQATILK